LKISKILVANRSEIAIRVFRAANELGIRTVAIWAEEDKYALHRFKADESYQVGRGPHLAKDMGPIESYLSIEEVIRVAKLSGADAIHPGYGLLSESPEFAEACAENGITFIGPKPETMRRLGNKVAARNLAVDIGVPVVPATDPLPDDAGNANLNTGTMLHHAVWTRPNIRDTTCDRNSAIGSQGMRFFAAGNERTVGELPAGFGYHVGTDPWNLIVEVMNHSEQPRTVYVSLEVGYVQAPADLRDTTPVWLDVDNCGNSEYAIPAGRSEQTWTWRSTVTGRVVSAGGHVHDGGVKTELGNHTTGEEMCTSVAGYGADPAFAGTIGSMSTCVWDRLGVVRTGEDLGIRATYDSSVSQDDAMGIVLAYVYETDDLDGGTPYTARPPPEQEPPPVHEH
jgi:hypothetical protein